MCTLYLVPLDLVNALNARARANSSPPRPRAASTRARAYGQPGSNSTEYQRILLGVALSRRNKVDLDI